VATPFPSRSLSAFVAGEGALDTGTQLLDQLAGEGLVPASLRPPDRELLRGALLRVYAETDLWDQTCRYLAASLLKLERDESELELLAWGVSEPLLSAYLEGSLNMDLELEEVLVRLRKRLLLAEPTSELLPLTAALAHHCFHNEYLYDLDDEERLRVAERCAALSAGPVDGRAVVVLGMFRAPLEFLTADQARQLASTTHPAPIESVVTRLVREPLEERELALSIATHATLDPVSTAVREHYEQNPYPRWYRLRRYRTSREQPSHLAGLPTTPRILVAGCGTGRGAVLAARRFPNSRIVALDISVPSLAYGARQARQLGCQQIDWVHGSLLDVDRLAEQFDLILCSGVLHHLGDDVRQAGWNALAGVLAPGGLLETDVYSALARIVIGHIRGVVASRRLRPTPEDMRPYRAELVAQIRAGSAGYKQLAIVTDFYSLSMLRDLLFHQHEHNYEIPELANSAAQAGLAFVGFELPNRLVERYHEQFPDDPQQVDLANWQRFEVHYTGSIAVLSATWRKA
jgi:SAM-dependent methyltransferase